MLWLLASQQQEGELTMLRWAARFASLRNTALLI